MDMNNWIKEAAKQKKPLPVLSFPGIQLINTTVEELVYSGSLQAECMEAVAKRYDTLAAVSLMDLSVEAEAFGSPVRFSKEEVPTVTAPIVKNEADAEALVVPKVGDKRTGEYVKTISEAKKRITDRPVIAGMIGPFSMSGRLMDMTEIMVMCYDEPEVVEMVLKKATAFLIEYGKAFKAAGADGVIIAEPAAGLLSPDLIKEFSVPYVKQIIEAIEDPEFLVIYHNCGNTIPLLPNILTMGAKALHFGNAIELKEALEIVPKDVVVFGNVDPARQFRNGTVESITAETQRILEACSGYENFILSSGCDIPPVSPLENIDAFFSVSKEFYKIS